MNEERLVRLVYGAFVLSSEGEAKREAESQKMDKLQIIFQKRLNTHSNIPLI